MLGWLRCSLLIATLSGCSGSEFASSSDGGGGSGGGNAGASSGGGPSGGAPSGGGSGASSGNDAGLGGKDGGSTGGGSGAPTTLYKPSGPVGLAVDDFNLYWGSQNTKDIVYAPKAGGGTPVPVVTESTSVYYVALAGGALFWTGTSNALKKQSLPNGSPTVLEPGLGAPLGVAVVGGKAFVAESTDSKLSVVDSNAGGELTTYDVQAGGYPEGVASDGTTLFVALVNAGKIVSLPVGGGAPQTFADNEPQPAGIAVDTNYVYWTTQGAQQTLRKKPRTGGAVEVLAGSLGLPTGVAVDDTFVYFAEAGAGRIRRVPK